MNIVIVGTGYVGLVSGACFSDMGITVTCVDTNVEKIARLRRGVMPIYEAGLEAAVTRNVRAGRLHFATDLAECGSDAEVIFCCVDTPPAEDGSADLGNVMAVARRVGEVLDHYAVIATKSTVPVGTTRLVERTIAEELSRRGVEVEFDVASNPEFLKEGVAVKDFMSPDRVVVGVESPRARAIMARLYKPFMLVSDRLIFTDIASAEMIKYASNSMLATRISFMNDVANLCEKVGADVNMVRKGVGTDTRIGNKFLYAGCGYGGSCFPKDVKALIRTAAEHGCRMEVLEAVERVNERQKGLLFRKLDAQRFETSLTHFEHSNIIPSIQTVLPFGGVLPDILCHDGEMFIYVIDGILTLDIGGDRQDLYPADSAHFMSSKCYRYWNETRYTTKIFVAKLMADASCGGSSTLSVSEVIR